MTCRGRKSKESFPLPILTPKASGLPPDDTPKLIHQEAQVKNERQCQRTTRAGWSSDDNWGQPTAQGQGRSKVNWGVRCADQSLDQQGVRLGTGMAALHLRQTPKARAQP